MNTPGWKVTRSRDGMTAIEFEDRPVEIGRARVWRQDVLGRPAWRLLAISPTGSSYSGWDSTWRAVHDEADRIVERWRTR